MAGIRISGMASGLPPNIVEQIMEAERVPVKTMETDKGKKEEKLKLVTELETKINEITKNLDELTGAGGFMDKKFISGDVNVVDGTVDPKNAIPGEWSVEVVELAQRPGALSMGFPDRNISETGVGYMKFETPQGTKEVYVGGGNTTLDAIAQKINRSGTGVRASVLNDRRDRENPFKLLVTGLKTGDDKDIQFPIVYMLDGDADFQFEEKIAAKNAKVKIDGFEVELPENESPDVIPGVMLDFKASAPGRPIKIRVKENLEVITGKVKTFVDSYNAALNFIQDQHKLKGNGANAKLGPLGGDSLIRSVESTLRRLILNPVLGPEASVKRVGDLGIEFNRNGSLNFDQQKFSKELNAHPDAVSFFLRGDGFSFGFIPMIKREIAALTNVNTGTLGIRKKGMNTQIQQVNDRIERKERQLEKREDGLRRKFTDLESKMSKMQAQMAQFQGAMKQQGG